MGTTKIFMLYAMGFKDIPICKDCDTDNTKSKTASCNGYFRHTFFPSSDKDTA